MEETSIGQAWKHLRLENIHKRAEFADILGIDRSSYTKIEKGVKPLLPYAAYRIFELYGVDMNYVYLGQVGGVPANLSSKLIAHLSGEQA